MKRVHGSVSSISNFMDTTTLMPSLGHSRPVSFVSKLTRCKRSAIQVTCPQQHNTAQHSTHALIAGWLAGCCVLVWRTESTVGNAGIHEAREQCEATFPLYQVWPGEYRTSLLAPSSICFCVRPPLEPETTDFGTSPSFQYHHYQPLLVHYRKETFFQRSSPKVLVEYPLQSLACSFSWLEHQFGALYLFCTNSPLSCRDSIRL